MTTLEKSQALVASVVEAFAKNDDLKVLIVCEDGNFFTMENKSHAEWHARSQPKPVELREVKREEVEMFIAETKERLAKEKADREEADRLAKEEADKVKKAEAAKVALAARAVRVGLPETASEEEVAAKEALPPGEPEADKKGKGKGKAKAEEE